MGYSDFANFKLVDGYQLNAADGYSFTTAWVDVHSAPFFDVSVVFSGGSPTGTVKLQKSNDLQFTGGNRPIPLQDGGVGAVSDAVDAPAGQGTVTAAVTGAGTFTLNQYMVGYRWFRVVFTSSNNASAKLDVFVNWKKP